MFERLLKRMREKIRTRQYIMTVHAEEEMDEDDLTIFDIEHCILTGEIIDVTIQDEMIEPIDTNRDADLVGITFVTPFAHRAYELASILKSQGKTVVFGGPHASLMPYEAKQFSDAVVIEEAEGHLAISNPRLYAT